MKFNGLITGLCSLLIITTLTCGCFQDDGFNVTINVLYSSPHYINNTTVYLDDDLFLQFKNKTIETYPPFLGDKTTRLKKGDHEISVIDTNFNLTRTKTLDVNYRMYVDIIISEDSIDISESKEQTEYK